MFQNNIINRHELLAQITEIVENSKTVDAISCIQVVGDAGIGKSTFLHQIPSHLTKHYISHQTLYLSINPTSDIIDALGRASHNSQGLRELLSSLPQKTLYEKLELSLSYIEDTKKEVTLLIIDDAQNLNDNLIEMLKMASESKSLLNPLIVILASCKSFLGISQITLAPFTVNQISTFFSTCFSKCWCDENIHLIEFIHLHTKGNPYFIYSYVKYLFESGGIRGVGIESLDSVKSSGIPENLNRLIKQTYNYSSQSIKTEKNT